MVNSGESTRPGQQVSARPYVRFVVLGIPRSPTSKSRSTWQAHVRGSAVKEWGAQPLVTDHVSVVLVHFFKDGALDVDNMIKPILDALSGIVFEDDRQVAQVLARKTELVTGRQVLNASPDVVAAIERGADFVYVSVESAPEHGVMP